VIEHAIKVVIDALEEKGIRSDRLVLVGGGSLTERSAFAVGADVYCPNAAAALETARALRAKRSEPAN
jgi:5-methyltetrahydrofolate--homocysteine methyltransferase